MWMKRTRPTVPFERYADDIVIHCESLKQAEELKTKIEKRLVECRLEVHPVKTKIVYCKDGMRSKTYENEVFDFLGFTFHTRSTKSKYGGRVFAGFNPAISRKAGQSPG